MSRFEYGIAIGFVAALLAPLAIDVLAWDAGVELPGMRAATEVASVKPGEWLDGTATAKAEQTLVGGSLLARWVVPHYNAAWYEATGRTAPAGRVNDEGWIFASSRTRPLPERRYEELLAEVPRAIRAAVDEVEAQGPRVVIALVPGRERMHPAKAYPGGRMPSAKQAYFPRMLEALRAQGLTVIELDSALRRLRDEGGEPFYRADHHWTSAGAQVAAEALAESLRAQGLVPACTEPGYEPYQITWEDEAEATSLLRKLGFPARGDLEQRWNRTYPRARMAKRGAWVPRKAPLAYVTTSYGKWGAPEQLSNALGCPVARALRDGNSMTSAVSLLGRVRRDADLAHTQLVVWELLEYDLYSAAGVPLGRDG